MSIKKHIKKLRYWALPLGVESMLRKSASILSLPPKLRKKIAGNEKFRDCHKNERCFILATGPSINSQDLTILQNDVCISVGEFYHHKDFKTINPLYHVDAPNHEPFDFTTLELLVNNYKEYLGCRTTIFHGTDTFKYSIYNYYLISNDLRGLDIYFLNYAFSSELNEFSLYNRNIWDLKKNLFACKTVVYSAIQVACYMGFKEIYLLGCDHDYLLRYFNNSFDGHHFYADNDGTDPEKVKGHLEEFTLERWFEQYYFRWKQYRLMNEYLGANNCKIFNATNGGMLDVFPRVRLEDVV